MVSCSPTSYSSLRTKARFTFILSHLCFRCLKQNIQNFHLHNEIMSPWAQTRKRPRHLSYTGARHTDFIAVKPLFVILFLIVVALCLVLILFLFVVILCLFIIILCLSVDVLYLFITAVSLFVVVLFLCGHSESLPGLQREYE